MFDERFHLLPSELHGCARSQGEVDFESQPLATEQQIEQMLGWQVAMVNESAESVEADGFDPTQVAFDHFGIVGPRPSQYSKCSLARPIPEEGM